MRLQLGLVQPYLIRAADNHERETGENAREIAPAATYVLPDD